MPLNPADITWDDAHETTHVAPDQNGIQWDAQPQDPHPPVISTSAPQVEKGDYKRFSSIDPSLALDEYGHVILGATPSAVVGQDTGIIGEDGGTHSENDPKRAGANAKIAAMLKERWPVSKIMDYVATLGLPAENLADLHRQIVANHEWRAVHPQYSGDPVVDVERQNVPNNVLQNVMGSDVGAALAAGGDASTAFALPKLAGIAGANPDEVQANIQAAESTHPKSAIAGTVAGGVAGTLGIEEGLARTAVPGLARVTPEAAEGIAAAAPVIRPMLANAIYGGTAGAVTTDTNAEGQPATATDRLVAAAEDAAGAAAIVPALHMAVNAPVAAYAGTRSVFQGSPGLARRIIAKAIKNDANTPESVGQTIADAHANNVPMALGDTGENVRGLMAASSRASGIGRTIVRDALEERQSALADRVTGHIERDLGPIANPHKIADDLLTRARTDADPLYKAAYARPGAPEFSEKVAPLLQRPSMKKALAYAYRTAQEEGRDPETLGLEVVGNRTTSILDANGNHIEVPEVTLTKAPSWQTLDYVKRGADDLVESYKNKVTGKYNFDTEGNAANNTLRSYLKAFDAANPDYAAARAAYAGPVKGINAMNTGRKFLSMTADDMEAQMRDMSPFEKQMAALGTRRAMAELVQSKGDTADIVHALVGTGKKRAMLARLFGDRQQFQRFIDTLGQEKEGWRSYNQALRGSPTAPNLKDDQALEGAAMAADFASGGMPVATATSKAFKLLRFKLGEKTQQQIAALLSNTDPAAIRELAAELRAKAEQRGIRIRRANKVSSVVGKGVVALRLQPQQSQ